VHGPCCVATEVFLANGGAVSHQRCRSKVAQKVALHLWNAPTSPNPSGQAIRRRIGSKEYSQSISPACLSSRPSVRNPVREHESWGINMTRCVRSPAVDLGGLTAPFLSNSLGHGLDAATCLRMAASWSLPNLSVLAPSSGPRNLQ
jgi:hypothetical protein